jgi:hypothetical protein
MASFVKYHFAEDRPELDFVPGARLGGFREFDHADFERTRGTILHIFEMMGAALPEGVLMGSADDRTFAVIPEVKPGGRYWRFEQIPGEKGVVAAVLGMEGGLDPGRSH